jgi:CheY-like chemotaxis protein
VTRALIGYEGKRKRLLIVDDVPHNRALLMDSLQALGFAVTDARNGIECLELLDAFKPDLIVMDVMMPEMNGHEATRRIRQMPAWQTLPIIAATAGATHEDEAACMAAGASAFLAKPVDLDLLLDTIGTLLSLNWISEAAAPDPFDQNDEQAADLVIPPAQEIEALYQLARIGNMKKISERATYLQELDPAYAPFAKRVHTLAQGYHSKALLAFVARYRRGPGTPE